MVVLWVGGGHVEGEARFGIVALFQLELSSGFYSRLGFCVLFTYCTLDPCRQNCFFLSISHRALSTLNTHTHANAHNSTWSAGLWSHSRKRKQKITWQAHLFTLRSSWLETRGWMPNASSYRMANSEDSFVNTHAWKELWVCSWRLVLLEAAPWCREGRLWTQRENIRKRWRGKNNRAEHM